MSAERRAALAAATRRRSHDARTRARAALRRLDRAGTPVTFTAVAAAADVSRSLLYSDPDIRAEITRLRANTPTATPPVPAAHRASGTSLHRRLEALLDTNRTLRDENQRLREQIAVLLGEQRGGSVPTRRHSKSIGPCS